MDNINIKVTFKGGGSLVNLRPKFSSSGENIFVCWHNTVYCYNTKTGKIVSEFRGVNGRIVGFDVYMDSCHEFLMACFNNGEIITWKVETEFRIMTKKTGKKLLVTMNLLPLRFENDLRVIVSYVVNGTIKFVLIDINSGNEIKLKEPRFKSQNFVIDVGNDYFCACHEKKVYFISTDGTDTVICHNSSKPVTCVACHPEERIALIGDMTGQVVLWQNIFSRSSTRAVFHWHTLPARTVAFSKAGSYFYSGGEESVLVRWQTDNKNQKKFLPRLLSTIIHISASANNTYLAVATTDNGIRIVDSRFNTVSLIQHMVIGNHFESGILVDPRTKALVMNGGVGQVQFYKPHDMSLLYKLDIVDQNKISNDRNCIYENTQVTKIAFSQTGTWMATVEERKDDEYTPERRLKFWMYNAEKQNFELNTSIEFPHEEPITNIQFQPTSNEDDFLCVTVGQDRKYKVWKLMDIDSIYRKGKVWNSIGVGYFRKLPCKGLSFSVDGSLIAIGFGPSVTAWVPSTCEIKCSLTRPFEYSHIQQVEFGSGNLCHLVVSATSNEICVWNILTLSMACVVPLDVQLLIADRTTNIMCAISTENTVHVFNPENCQQLFSSATLLKPHNKILTAAFVPSRNSYDIRLKWYQRSHIFFIDSDKELYCIGSEDEYAEPAQEIEEVGKSLVSMAISKPHSDGNKSTNPTLHLYEKDTRQTTLQEYLEAPAQPMVPVRIQCKSLLRSLLLQKDAIIN